jgi:lysophospholipase L1-like esterase
MNIKKFRKATTYNAEKQNKKDNFTYLNENYCKGGQTVLIGDSITEIFNDRELLAQYTQETGIAVYNRGISGDTTDRLIERLEDNLFNIKPRNVVLLIGTNDFGLKADLDYVYNNIKFIVETILERCPDVNLILEAVLPVGGKIQNPKRRYNKKTLKLNEKLKLLAQTKNIAYFDITDKISDKHGNLDSKYTYDGLHPNVYGFEITAKEILKLLK